MILFRNNFLINKNVLKILYDFSIFLYEMTVNYRMSKMTNNQYHFSDVSYYIKLIIYYN